MSEITQQKATPHSSGKRMAQPGQTPPCERVFRLPHHMEVRAAHCSATCTRQTPGLNHAPAKQSRHLRQSAAHQRRLRRKTSQTKCTPGRTAQAETTSAACCSGEGGKASPRHSTNQSHAPAATGAGGRGRAGSPSLPRGGQLPSGVTNSPLCALPCDSSCVGLVRSCLEQSAAGCSGGFWQSQNPAAR